ncbi:MAG: PASTA domain-containing protein [Solirubrobacteraceae bacterium]
MSTVGQGQGQAAAAPAPFSALPAQIAASVAGTMIGEALGDTLPEKLIAGMLIAVIGAFLVAPGKHRRRRIVAVALLLALLDMLRRAIGAAASTGRKRDRDRPAARTSQSWAPASWAAVGLATVAGFGLGSLGTTAVDGWASESDPDPPKTAQVPDIHNRSEQVALRMLSGAMFKPVTVSATSLTIADGRAIRTAPAAGERVALRSTIRLYLSTGPPPRDAKILVPVVKGLRKAEARFALKDAGLRVTSKNVVSKDIAAGDATGTSPPAGERVARNAKVTLLVSTGPPGEKVDVPAVENRSEREALTILREAGLNPRPSRREPSEDFEAGRAIRTDPAAGRSIEKGSEVTLYVSSGSDETQEKVQVPDVVGARIADARAQLAARDLGAVATPVRSSEPKGTVVAMDPGAGVMVPSGQDVALEVSDGSLVRVPDLVGMLREDARVKVEGLDLVYDANSVPSSPDEEGRVLATAPAGRTEVKRGSTVMVDVGCGDVSCVD